jgi:hypothetical protein
MHYYWLKRHDEVLPINKLHIDPFYTTFQHLSNDMLFFFSLKEKL